MPIRIEIQSKTGFMDASQFFEEQERKREAVQIPNHLRHIPGKDKQLTTRNPFPESLPDETFSPLLPGINLKQDVFLRKYLEGTPLKQIAEEGDVDISYVAQILGTIRKITHVPKNLKRHETMEYLQELIDAHRSNTA